MAGADVVLAGALHRQLARLDHQVERVGARLERQPRDLQVGGETVAVARVPWHRFTTGLFVVACWSVAISTLARYPQNAGVGVGILAIGALVYPLWQFRRPSKTKAEWSD